MLSRADIESGQKMIDDTVEQFGRIDTLVNCAGVTEPVAHDDLDGLTDESIDRIFRGDLTTIAAENDGVFPLLDVFQIVDGRSVVGAHGSPRICSGAA